MLINDGVIKLIRCLKLTTFFHYSGCILYLSKKVESAQIRLEIRQSCVSNFLAFNGKSEMKMNKLHLILF